MTLGFDLAPTTTWQPWAVLAGGVLLTSVMAACVLLLLVRAARNRRWAADLLAAEQRQERDVVERTQAEETERASNARYRTLIEALPQKIFYKDANSVYVTCNENYARDLGIAPTELPGKTDYDFYPRELADKYRADDRAIMASGKTQEFDEAYLEDGEERFVHTVKTPVTDEDGNVIGILGIFWDITERKRVEQTQARLVAILDATPDFVGFADGKDTHILYINPAGRKMVGVGAQEDVTRLKIADVHPEWTNRLFRDESIPTAIRDGIWTGECAFLNRDSREIPVMMVLLTHKSPSGEVERFSTISRDVTERKQAEQELRRLAMIAQQAAEGIAVANLDGIIQFANPAWAHMHGYQPEELVGKHLSMFHNEEQVKTQVMAFNEQALRDGSHSGEVGHIRRDGTPFPTRMVTTLLRDESGQPLGLIGLASDISQQKQAEERLAAAYRQLEVTNEELNRSIAQANQLAIGAEMASVAKSQFLANMSHEIRTPMNAIVGMVELALDTDLTAEQREYLVAVNEAADSLLELINGILDLAKVEAGRLELETIDFRLRDTIGDALKVLALRAHEIGLELAYDVDPEVPEAVVGDPGRLRQVITNLVGNAIKFTPEGQVVVRVEVETEAQEEVLLHFSVADTGIGIPEDRQELIFQAFAQVDGSASRRYGGTGLGLAISAQLVAQMGGRLWVESKPGEGSTFHFTARLGLSKGPALVLPAQPVDTHDLPVLVVDDNATNRRILEQMLTGWHMRPRVAGEGQEALAAMRQAREAGEAIALVLLDAHMPGMDGFAVAERIKQDPELATATIIMLTSAGLREDAARCRRLGISAYLTKPIKQSELWDAIMTTLGAPPAEGPPRLVTRHSLRESRRRLRILLGEDNAINQKVAVRMLEKRGHLVAVATNGKEALALLQRESFDLVLMDVQMPEMDGFEATANIRKQEWATGHHLPIIAMTAHAMEGDRERCLAAGMDGYIAKPVNAKALFDAIEGLTRGPRDPKSASRTRRTQEEVLDKAILLARVEGDMSLLREVLSDFSRGLPGMLAQIAQAVAGGEALKLERVAHALKGALGAVGARRASELALKLESIGRSSELAQAEAARAQLEAELEHVQQALTTMLEAEAQ